MLREGLRPFPTPAGARWSSATSWRLKAPLRSLVAAYWLRARSCA